MSTSVVPIAPLRPGGPGLLRWVCTGNPFYVVSAGLFLIGLYLSFGAARGDVQTGPLMAGLAAFTLLLAGTASLLVRFGNVWDDVRTLLLLVVLMLLATSVTFDELLALEPTRGAVYSVGGLLFAIALSEGLLRSTRLALPALFRLPYYLILALFFLYPLALAPFASQPHSETLLWGLFGFPVAAGVVFLTLLPAVRRGPDYVRNNGSPWTWPLYPWTLFALLALAVPARAFLLCWSMHLLNDGDRDRIVFGPFFLVPFGLAVAVLLLEIGLVSRHRGVLRIALGIPAALVALAALGHRDDSVYRGFRELFAARLGADPLYLTLLAAAAFQVYAAVRGVRLAPEALTAALVTLVFVGPDSLNHGLLPAPRPLPLLTASLLQVGLGIWRRQSWRCLLGGGGLVAVAAFTLTNVPGVLLRSLIVFHLGLAVVVILGSGFGDRLAQALRIAAVVVAALVALAVLFGLLKVPAGLPLWLATVYPLAVGIGVVGYGYILRQRLGMVLGAGVLACWLGANAMSGYSALRQSVSGLDHIALSLGVFGVAVLVSLAKAGALSRWGKLRRVTDEGV